MSIFKNPFARLSISPTPNTSIKLNSEQVKDFKTFLSRLARVYSLWWISIECSSRCRMHNIAFLESKMHSCVLSATGCVRCLLFGYCGFSKNSNTQQQHVSCLRDATSEMRIAHCERATSIVHCAHTPFIPAERDHLMRYQSNGVSHL